MNGSTHQLYCVLLIFFAAFDFSQGRKLGKASAQGSGSGVVCPANETIAPCECYFKSRTSTYPTIECKGDFKLVNLVTQETLDNLFKQLRAVNNLALNETLELHYIQIYQAWKLTELDLTPFINLKINRINFETYYVARIRGPSPPSGKIQVTKVVFYGLRNLTDEGLGDALKYFDTSTLRDLRFEHNAFKGGHYPLDDGSGDVEFIPGLSAFTNLEKLSVAGAVRVKIINVHGGQFKRNIRLSYLDMGGNWINKLVIGQEAFMFGQSPPELVNIPIKFAARYSTIENGDSEVDTSIKEPPPYSRPVELDFSHGRLEFLKEDVYKPFLDGHPNNSIILNKLFRGLICDERMKWLKSNRELYEHRVLRSACKNDPNYKSIFETDLIQT